MLPTCQDSTNRRRLASATATPEPRPPSLDPARLEIGPERIPRSADNIQLGGVPT